MKSLSTKLIMGLLAFVYSSLVMAVPPFLEGQIVVEGEPKELSELKVLKKLPKSGLTVYSVESGREFGQLQKLRKQGFRAGLNFIAHASLKPNDSFYRYQWHLPAIQSEQAWDITRGANSRVAVLDTGIVTGGKDGVNQCSFGYDVVNLDSNPHDGSDLSHGTHVAGTISQLTNFDSSLVGYGAVGMAPEACVMPIKVLDDSGSGSFADIAEGIYIAVDNGADVINMSLGVNARYGITSDPLVDPALDYAESKGVLVVAAAGNDGFQKNVSYPAIYSSVVAVGATDFNNQKVRYSNSGTGLDLMAPGGDTSVDNSGDSYPDGVLQESYSQTNGYGHYFLQGTSMASPHVAGVAALMVAHGFTDLAYLRDVLLSSTLDLESAGYDNTTGFGLVQAFNALVTGTPVAGGPPAAPSEPTPANNATDVSLNTTLNWTGSSDVASYRVYFGGSSLEFVGETSQTSFDPGTLNYFTNYQWQVVAVNNDGETSGSVWFFTTEEEPTETETGGSLTDNDGDGYYAEQGDCNDYDRHVYPGHNDTKGRWGKDGVDNDCNGVIDG